MRQSVRNKTIGGIISLLIILVCSLIPGGKYLLAAEKAWDQAEDITELDVAEGKNKDGKDDHIYQFDVEKNGYIVITFEQKKGIGIHEITVYDSGHNEVYFAACEKDMDKYTSPKFSISKGVNYIEIHSSDNPEEYSLSVQCEKNRFWETEPDNLPDQAVPISVNRKYNGSNVNKDDLDYYSFQTDKDAYIVFDFGRQKDGGTHDITICNDKQEEICQMQVTAEEKDYVSPKLGIGSGRYFIKIGSDGNYDPCHFTVNCTEDENWEKEPDNSRDQAGAIKTGILYNGSCWSKDDCDYYSFSAEKDGTMVIAFNHDQDQGSHVITVYDAAEKEIARDQVPDNMAEYSSKEIPVNKGKNIIKIDSAENRGSYSFRLDVK